MLPTALTQNETLIYNSFARGDDMKARVLKTQMLISCTIKGLHEVCKSRKHPLI